MSVSIDLLRRAWPDGYLAMRGVSTVGHELFRGSMKHSDDPFLLGIRFCEAVADSYRYGEQSGSPDDEVGQTMGLMVEKRIRHLPVVESGQLAGLVSIGDVVKAHHARLTMENHYLMNYIQS